jgi:spermidine/putrescine-binding protein
VDVKTDNDKYSDEWLTFKKESETKIQVNEEKITAFRERMKRTGTKIKTNYDKETSNLEETNKELKKTLTNYKNGGRNVWNYFKTGFNNALDRLSII